MNEAVRRMLSRYDCRTVRDSVNALREIMQEIVLLGLWRGKFFEHAAFYGGTALRILYGLDRYSEDLDFSLLKPNAGFDLEKYTVGLEKELRGFGFDVRVEQRNKAVASPIQSAFLKTNTLNALFLISSDDELLREISPGRLLKIKLEIDTDPPGGFDTETGYLLHPLPFGVQVYTLPDLFAGKMHALLCRKWRNRVKGRDWYDLVWYIANHPRLHLSHLEQRMRQSGHYTGEASLGQDEFQDLLNAAIDRLDVDQARKEVELFVKDVESLAVWSRDFFRQISRKIICV